MQKMYLFLPTDYPNNTKDFEIVVEYFAVPSVENKTLLLAAPMLATG